MGLTMVSFTEKIDVLDILINILQEHERKLDELVSRLEGVEERYTRVLLATRGAVQPSPSFTRHHV